MITDVPQGEDFRHSGRSFLNLAWSNAIGLYSVAQYWEQSGGYDKEQSETYWQAAQRPLAAALALAQQGIEFLLKARVAEVSPFLLISGSPRDWPRSCDRVDVPFAEFRTIDAQDLIRAHDAVSDTRVSDEFKQRFEQLRNHRNTVFHTVDYRIRVTVDQVLLAILEASDELLGRRIWFDLRRTFLDEEERTALYLGEDLVARIAREMLAVVDGFKPADVIRFVGFNKKQRRYICPACYDECMPYEVTPNLAHLHPNTPVSTAVYCHICKVTRPVNREPCKDPKCRGNVLGITKYRTICLTCGTSQTD